MSMVFPHFSQRTSSRTRSHPIHKRAFAKVMPHKVWSVGRFDTSDENKFADYALLPRDLYFATPFLQGRQGRPPM
jgi:hypothetical protein